MNKNDLAELIAVKARLTKKDALLVVDNVFDTILEALLKGEEVMISRFGTFKVKTNASRIGTNPLTSEKIEIPSKKTLAIKVSNNVKELLNK